MKLAKRLSLTMSAVLLTILHGTASVAAPAKADLKGSWVMKSATCTNGTALPSLKNVRGTLTYDGSFLTLAMTDKKGKKQEAFSSDKFAIQEDLLSIPTGGGVSTMKIEVANSTNLTLRLPAIGLAGDCPTETELQVLKFQRTKI